MNKIKSKVINTILTLTDKMSAPLKAAAKATNSANKQLENAKKELDKHKAASVKNTEALKKSKAEVADLKKVQSMYRMEVARAEQQIKELTSKTGLNKKQQKENKIAIDAARRSLETLRKSQNATTSAIEKAEAQVKVHKNALDASNKKIKEARERTKKYSKQVADTTKKLKEAEKTVKQWGKSALTGMDNAIKKALKFGAVTLGATTGAAATVGLGEAINLEGYKSQLETATKSTEKASMLMSNAIKLANNTPFETGQVVEATAIMESYKISSEKWLKDVADMAGATNKDILQATEAMADASMGEFERLKEFGILKEELIAAAAEKYGKYVVFSKSGQVKDRLKLETILQETMQSKFKGGAEKQAKTMKGLWSTIVGVTKTSLAQILGITEQGTIRQGSLYELLKNKMQLVVDLLNKWQKDGTIEKVTVIVTNAVTSIIDKVIALYNFFMEYKNIIIMIVKFVATMCVLAKVIVIVTAVTKALSVAWTILKVLFIVFNALITMSPLGWLILAIMGVVAAGYLLVKVLIKIWEIAGKAFGVVKKVLGFGDKKIETKSTSKEEKNIKNKNSTEIDIPGLKDIDMGMPEIEVPKLNNTPLKNETGNTDKKSSEAKEVKKEIKFIFNFKGDVYGMENFREKVAEAVIKSYSVYKSNVL